jgi:tRNA A-37 threonylcarbamoyl transferase component Bud32
MTEARITPQHLVTTLTTAADALRGEEVDRTRAFIRLGWIVALGVAAAVLLLPGDPGVATALLAVLGVGVLGSVWVYRQLGDGTKFRSSRMYAVALAAIVCGQLGILYVGVTSAAPLIVALGLYFFCRTENLAAAVAVYLVVAGAHLIEAALVIGGVIDDPGFAPVGARLSVLAHVAGHVILQMMYAMCFVLARLTRKTSLRSIEQLQKATRLAAQRDVQLAELRQDLDRALKIGGPGRFTGQIVGTWTLGNVLGRGAMGEVYEASNGTREAAVKLLRRELLADPLHVERFFREVRVAGSLDSPHVVRVLEASTPEDPIPFLAMERLRGQTLGELVRSGPVTGPRLHTLVAQIGGALERARGANIIHRDLKPHNLFLHEDGTWKVLDFGVAILGDSTGTLTKGAVVGTPTYMAPEQARGEQVDHRADLYALGAVIYRCLTGRVPFAARDTPALLYSVVHIMPARPTAIATLGAHQEAFLAVALAKSRDERFQTAAELMAYFADAERGALPDPILRRARLLVRKNPWTEPDPIVAPVVAR